LRIPDEQTKQYLSDRKTMEWRGLQWGKAHLSERDVEDDGAGLICDGGERLTRVNQNVNAIG